MEKRLYEITFFGSEDSRSCTMMLTDEEADLLIRMENFLQPQTGYVPHIILDDVEKSRKLHEQHKAKLAEEAKKKLDHAMGLDKEFKTSMQMAFENAKSLRKNIVR